MVITVAYSIFSDASITVTTITTATTATVMTSYLIFKQVGAERHKIAQKMAGKKVAMENSI